MNIALNQVEQYKEQTGVREGHRAYEAGGKHTKADAVSDSFYWGGAAASAGNQAYRKEKGNEADLLEEASAYDAKNAKDSMVVMSNTLSDEDYKKIMENGGNPGDYEPGEMVTVIDEIKVTLAQAGVSIEGYTDDLSKEAVKEVTGEACAEAIANALKAKKLPFTEKNIRDCYAEIEKAAHLTELSDGAKKYMLENDMEPTIDSMYKASYAGADDASKQAEGYFGAGAEGYFAKKGTAQDLEALNSQIQKVIEAAGMEINEKTLSDARWILEKGLPLTEENLFRLQQLNDISFPIGAKEAALAAADAISVGLSAKEANLSVGDGYQSEANGYIQRAVEINEKTQALTEEAVTEVSRGGKALTLFNLFQLGNMRLVSGSEQGGLQTDVDTAKKQLLEIQLHMSAQANLKLLKQGIQIELKPFDDLLSLLKKEEGIFHATELSDIQSKAEEIKALPAATIGISVREAWMREGSFTLNRVYETGKVLEQTYRRAEQSYEALMTAPRADLGDSIKTAFRNVDDLLAENNFEVTADNQRAVRILGYNHMEISTENMEAVKEADAMLSRVLSNLTPQKTLQMIREGKNPLEMNLDVLSEYLSATQSETEEIEKYSKYLYQLEKNDEITQEEREAYIGIYRLLKQVEKSDGAALGSVVANGQELNLENLLSAVRTRKKGYVDAKIDDAFGFVSEIVKNKTSISDQILNYYHHRAGQLADDLSGDFSEGGGYDGGYEGIEQLRSMGAVSEEHFNSLLQDQIPVTANNVFAQQELAVRGNLFTGLFRLAKGQGKEKELKTRLDQIKEAFLGGKEAVNEAVDEAAEDAAKLIHSQTEVSGSYIDVRSMAFYARQMELVSRHAKEESYYVPVQLSDEWTMLHVRIVNGEKQGKVSIDYKGDGDQKGAAKAVFIAKGDRLEGLIGVADEADLEKYEALADKCAKEILEKSGREADITCIHSQMMNPDALTVSGTEQNQASAKVLYEVAKAFIHIMEQEVTANESKL